MIVHTFDNGWGSEFAWKKFEQYIVSQLVHDLAQDSSRTVIINSVWYTHEYHQSVMTALRSMQFDTIVLVAMLDAAIPQADWYSEFKCRVVETGYYPGHYYVDQCALFVHEHYQPPSVDWLMDSTHIDMPFMCLNRKPHWHRVQLYNNLVALDINHKGIVSMGSNSGPAVQELVDDGDHDTFAPNASKNHFGVPNDVASIGHLGNWRRHFVNVVTETFYEINRNHFVTEKLYKPIIGCRPFLIYDPDGGIKWLAAAGFENYTQDFKDISDLNPAEPAQLPHFLKTLSEQSVSYWKKKFIDLSDKILYNKTHFDEYVRQQKSIVAKGISCQI